MTGYRQRRWAWKLGVGLCVLLCSTGSARAFYWVGWPGAGSPTPPRIVSETIQVDHRDPTPVNKPPGGEPWRPPGDDDEPPPPGGVPEPTTIVLAGVGLAVAGMRLRRKRRAN